MVEDLRRLTPKQRDTLRLLEQGHTSKEMAKILGVSASAIDQRIECIMRNNGFEDRRDLMRRLRVASAQSTTEAAQVASTHVEHPSSNTDRTHSDLDSPPLLARVGAGPYLTGVPPISEAAGQRPSLLSAHFKMVLEAMFFAMMTILGACVMLKQLLV